MLFNLILQDLGDLEGDAMGEERIAVILSHAPQELIAGVSVMRKNVTVCKWEGKSGHRIKMNLPPSSVTFKVYGGERDEGEKWYGTDGTQDPKLA